MNLTAKRRLPILAILFASCVEPYSVSETNYDQVLVVEGFISGATQQHKVLISRTSPLNQTKKIPEKGAVVQIQSSTGEIIPLMELSPGTYVTPFTSGVAGRKYKLKFTISSGRSYSSDEVTMKNTPPIGTITAKFFKANPQQEEGIQIYLNTEDPSGKSRYYRWEYDDTYEIKTPYVSNFEWAGGNIVLFRTAPVDRCWAMDTSRNVITYTTENLQQDKVSEVPIKFLQSQSEALVVRYSMLIRQYAMSEKSYLYWKNLKAVSEKQGTLFDVQPGPVLGNITADSGSGENVLGYFDAATVSEKRVFFTPDQFTEFGFVPPEYRTSCTDASIVTVPALEIGDFMSKYSNVLEIYNVTSVPRAGYLLLPRHCCNCSSDGTSEKPSYWPN